MRLDVLASRAADRIDSPHYLPPHGSTRWPPVQQWAEAHWSAWLTQHGGWSEDAIAQYLDHDRYAYGFGLTASGELASPHTAHDVGTRWLYLPTPQGVTLHQSQAPNLLWGGSAGGAKSTSARWELWRTAFSREGYRAIVIRRELEQLRRTHLDKFDREAYLICEALDDAKAIKVTSQPAVVTIHRSNAKIICGHCHNDNDHEKYLSEDYDDFLGDEATWLLPQQIVGIAGRLRNDTKTGRTARMMLTTNPGGPSHDWCVQHFLTKDVTDEPMYEPTDYQFIRSRLYDNPFYMDADGTYTTYEKRLSAYLPQRRKQLLDGDWSIVVGQFFADFDARRHLATLPIPPQTPVEVWFRSGVGGKAPYLCVAALLPDGRVYIFAEILFRDETIGEIAKVISHTLHETITRKLHVRWTRSIASADLFPTGNVLSGESPIETCRRYGLYLQKGDDQEVFGWSRLRHWLRSHPTAGTPWLVIDPDCTFLARTLPTVVGDPEAPDLLSSFGETQAAHALRIGVMARPSPSPLSVIKPVGSPESIQRYVNREKFGGQTAPGMVR